MSILPAQLHNFIGGGFRPAVGGRSLDNVRPATGEVYSRLPDSGPEDVALAVEAAAKAFPAWSVAGVEFRYSVLNRLADLVGRHAEQLAQAESADSGKSITTARQVDIPRAEANLRFFATAILHFSTQAHIMEGTAVNYTLRQPVGVVACISPWNLPLYLFTWKIAPALAAGNCVVAKPSELTPMTAYLFSELCQEAGLPPGVLNIVHGLGPRAGQAMVEHPQVKAVSFTGGTATGRTIARTAAPLFKKLSLELGGKNPVLVFSDCDLEEALATTVRSSFSNNGQICLCGSRIYVERTIYESFRDELVRRVRELRTGDPASEDTDLGSLVSLAHRDKVLHYLRLAQEEGGTILTGGTVPEMSGRLSGGAFLSPAVIEGLPLNCRTNQEEIFGPVVTIQPFDDESEALAMANGVAYGLAATVWTRDLSRANRIAAALQAGIVWVNCWMLRDLRTPFGGMKQSGVGREGGEEALRFFTEARNVCLRY
jgi:aminomuconate-semialdehyde/2-hydroxymuconate-6-semialdehyde dehydrogenase